jgi:hypothetical protein
MMWTIGRFGLNEIERVSQLEIELCFDSTPLVANALLSLPVEMCSIAFLISKPTHFLSRGQRTHVSVGIALQFLRASKMEGERWVSTRSEDS